MRVVLIFLFGFFLISSYAQIPGRQYDGKAYLADSISVGPGDTLWLGMGTMPDGTFKYIYQPYNMLAGSAKKHLRSHYAQKSIQILHLKLDTKGGNKYYAVVNPDYNYNKMVDLDLAIQCGEVVGVNKNRFSRHATNQLSVADELIKLKGLLDAGAITKDEYEQQKKKLLN